MNSKDSGFDLGSLDSVSPQPANLTASPSLNSLPSMGRQTAFINGNL